MSHETKFRVVHNFHVGAEDPTGPRYVKTNTVGLYDTRIEAEEAVAHLRADEWDFSYYTIEDPPWYLEGLAVARVQAAAYSDDPNSPDYVPF